ncbi:PKD domain-containing protein [Blastococcus aggregatus]|nr:PKD domain-containing protein [Blastococcus aggregatus]
MSARTVATSKTLTAGLLAALLLMGVLGGVFPATARADWAPLAPTEPSTPTTVTADALPTVQINGVAWTQVVVGNTVYVGGNFSTARPAGSPAGTAETPRSNLLAYDIRTGELITSFAPTLDGQVISLAASPNGSRLYVGGDFGRVNGAVRSRIAAFDTATGQLVPDFRPAVSGQVSALAVSSNAVYFGGTVTAVGSVPRNRLAAVSPTDGALLAWAPQPGGTSNVVLAMVLAGTNQVVVAGRFATLNGSAATGVGALDATTGATKPFAVSALLKNQGPDSAIMSLATANGVVYGTGYDYGGPGNLEGTFAARADGGAAVWFADCRGDHYSAYATTEVVYTSSHAHDCANIGAFGEQTPRYHDYAQAVSAAPTGTVQRVSPWINNRSTNNQLVGQPAPTFLAWNPTFQGGTFTGQFQAGWSVAGNGDYVVYGGEFPSVNGSGQQGLVRFAVRPLAPGKVGPQSFAPFTVTPTMLPGGVRVTWPAVADRDNENLTYRVYRDTNTSTPVCEVTRPSRWWKLPTYGCTDTGASAGEHRWQVTMADASGNQLASAWVTGTVPAGSSSTPRRYAQAVMADGATNHWYLGEPSGGIAYDYAGTGDLTASSGVTRGTAGAIQGDANRAATFSGTSTGTASTGTPVAGPQTFSVEAWFKTTSRNGGKIVGFGDRTTGQSTNYDRHVYMDTAGRLNFGIYTGAETVVSSPGSYNDGTWHHVVATMSSSGLAMYVDGTQVGSRTGSFRAQAYNGYWRVGGDTSWSGGAWFAGAIDEVAVYPVALTAQQVSSHSALGRGQNLAPAASFTSQVTDLTARVDGTGSTDPEDAPLTYAWDFGDGTTGTGATASHTYTAAGTYTVRLTVTDAGGLTATTTRSVTASAPPTGAGSIAADTFGREVPSGWGTAERGGAWTTSGSTSVTAGTGRLVAGAGQSAAATLAGVSRTDVAVQATLTLPALTTGGGTYVSLASQNVGLTDYRAKLRFRADGQVEVMLMRTVNDEDVILGGYLLAGGYSAGTSLNVRLETSGTAPTTVQVKVWKAGTAEPAAWDLSRTDSTAALQRPGGVRLDIYTTGSATAATTVRVDDLRVEPAGTVVVVPNEAPVAAFTATTSQLTATVDGSASTDDAGVAGHVWDFGDGATATGVAASHTYTAAGTYTVRLTVTDAAGLTGTTTRSVTVTAPTPPPAGTPIAADTFGREVTSGWGTAEVGGAWTTSGSTSVTAGTGRLVGGAGQSAAATLAGVSRTDVAVQATLTLPALTTGGGTYVSLASQNVGLTDYRAKLRFRADGQVEVMLMRTVNDEDVILGGYLLAGGYSAGTSLNVRLETSGTAPTTVQVKVWKAGTAEPAAWDLSRTDSTAALQRPGGVRLDIYTSGSATAATTVRVDDLRVDPAGTSVTQPDPQPEPQPEPEPEPEPEPGTDPPANQAPVAAFTAVPSGLTVAVDGSSSTDDAAVTGYAWDFGDGTTGTGATASRTYTAAGTYTVRLTVTDAAGLTGTTTRSVTVTAPTPPPAGTPLAADAFDRAVTGGWGTADIGGAWVLAGAPANASVADGAGLLTGPAGQTTTATFGELSLLDSAVQVGLTLPQVPTGGGVYVSLASRSSGTTDYSVKLRFRADGQVEIMLIRTVNDQDTILDGYALRGGYQAGTTLNVRFDVSGTTTTALKVKAWKAGTIEPAAWDLSRTDSTAALQRAGSFAVQQYVSGTATSAVPVRVEQLWIGESGTAPAAQ